MAKLGLCVRFECNNYGSMLQIVATQKMIIDMGWEYELIQYDKNTILFYFKNIPRIFNPYFMRGKRTEYLKKKKLKTCVDVKKQNDERNQLFYQYRSSYIGPYSKIYKGYRELKKCAFRYDAIMVGSDQLWTPAGLRSKFYNLLFVPEQIKKISFATSFGVTEIPKRQVRLTKKYLERIEYISVRESAGAKIVKSLTGKEAVVTLDPTLLFSRSEWEEMFPSEIIIEKPYIFAYFLGTEVTYRNLVNRFAEKTGLKIVTCPHMDEYVEADETFGDEQLFHVGPVDFLNLIRGAEYICTDSFHGSIFSILHHKKFLTFDRYSDTLRKSKNSRIQNLFKQLELQERYFHGDENIPSYYQRMTEDIDYSVVDRKLQELRKLSLNFLHEALDT